MKNNPAHAVQGPKHSVRKGKTSVLSPEEKHELLAAIDTTSLLGLRDRALIALMGLHLCPGRVGHRNEGRMLLRSETPPLGTAAIAASGLGTEPEAPLFATPVWLAIC